MVLTEKEKLEYLEDKKKIERIVELETIAKNIYCELINWELIND